MEKNEILSRIRRKLEEQNVSEACIETILHALEKKENLEVSTIVFSKKDVHEMLLAAKEQLVIAHSTALYFSSEGSGFTLTKTSLPWLVTIKDSLLYMYMPKTN